MPHDLGRRSALRGAGALAGALALSPLLPARPASAALPIPSPDVYDWRFDLGTSPVNLLRDGRFKLWHSGTVRVIPATSTTGVHFCGRWLGVPHTPSTLFSPKQHATASRIDATRGGVRLRITNPGVFYLRQYLFGDLPSFSRRTYSVSVDVDVERVTMVDPAARPASLRMDLYVQARYNANAAHRVLVTDTRERVLPSGRSRLITTFTVPTLNPTAFPRDVRQSLELAVRPLIPSGVREAVVSVREVVLTEGTQLWSGAAPDDRGDLLDLIRFFETGLAQYAPTGPVRTVAFRQQKWRKGSTVNLALRDHLGAAGKVSVLSTRGVLVGGVTPTVRSSSAFLDGFSVGVAGSGAAGLVFAWKHNVL